jgi:hypothetical protein
MRRSVVVLMLAAGAAVGLGCFADDTAPSGQPGGSAGSGGSGGSGGKSTGGAAGKGGVGGSTAGASGAGAGGARDGGADIDEGGTGGTGGTAGSGGAGGAAGSVGGAAGSAGTGGTDACGQYRPLPFTVFSAFTTLRICSNGTCTAPQMPYYFAPIANPNCNEVFPDGGIVPPFADGGLADATGAEDALSEASADAPVADMGADSTAVESGADIADVSTEQSADVSAEASADVRIEGGAAEASSDATAPACYAFLYNPDCPNGLCWGGVIFTQSAGGMSDVGICIELGATKITFQAKASRPDARIKFGAIREGLFQTEFFLNITTNWATYEVTIPPGEPYNTYSSGAMGVWNGFSVIVEPQDHPGGTYIFVKDAIWMK